MGRAAMARRHSRCARTAPGSGQHSLSLHPTPAPGGLTRGSRILHAPEGTTSLRAARARRACRPYRPRSIATSRNPPRRTGPRHKRFAGPRAPCAVISRRRPGFGSGFGSAMPLRSDNDPCDARRSAPFRLPAPADDPAVDDSPRRDRRPGWFAPRVRTRTPRPTARRALTMTTSGSRRATWRPCSATVPIALRAGRAAPLDAIRGPAVAGTVCVAGCRLGVLPAVPWLRPRLT